MSFVLVSLSMSTMLNETSTASFSAFCRNACSTGASVVMKQSIVAMFGWIMPTPLQAAPIVQPPAFTAMCFFTVSVVMIATAKSRPPSGDSSIFSMPAAMRSIGSCVPMTPVEATTTSCGSMPSFSPAELRHLDGVVQALLAGRGVGAAGVGHDRLRLAVRQVLLRDEQRRSLQLVAGVRRGRRCTAPREYTSPTSSFVQSVRTPTWTRARA